MEFERLYTRSNKECPSSLKNVAPNVISSIEDDITRIAWNLATYRNKNGFPPQPLPAYGMAISELLYEIDMSYDEFACLTFDERQEILEQLKEEDEYPESDRTLRYMDDGTVHIGQIGEPIKRYDERFNIHTWEDRIKEHSK